MKGNGRRYGAGCMHSRRGEEGGERTLTEEKQLQNRSQDSWEELPEKPVNLIKGGDNWPRLPEL